MHEVRKTVTVVFSDVAGSTALGELLDPESLRCAMTRYFETARRVHERHGGVVEKFIGDAVMAVYGIPRAHEDDPLRAVRAAFELRGEMDALNRELRRELDVALRVRSGVATGLVVAGDERQGHAFVGGDTVNVAARLQQTAPAGEVLLGEATWRLVADAVLVEPTSPFVPRGRRAPILAYRLLQVDPERAGRARRLDTPLVGRDRELAALDGALDRVAAGGPGELVTVVSDAGVGKSRLLRAFAERAGERAQVLRCRCPSYGDGRGDRVVAALFAQATGTDRPDGLGGDPMATFRAVRRLLEALASRRPTVLLVDDLHWAEPDLLDLLEYVHAFAGQARLLLVVAARPELLERRPCWTAQAAGSTLRLEPLPAPQAAALAAGLGAAHGLDAAAAEQVAAWAEGVPLFVEELLRHLGELAAPGHLGPPRPLAARLAEAAVPPAVEALLGAELDQLPAEERAVLGLASMAGRVFDWELVAALAPAPLRPRVGALLLALCRRQLVRAAGGPHGDAYAFRHLLLREVAYQAIPRQERAVLHVRVAEHLPAGDGRVGDHLELAYRYLTDDRPRPPAATAPPVAATA
ncbi:MAG TPA: AAA family ATPase [Actinomycetes bacterium]|jgi:class 3 adenylate cyclase|nr:AAA family ATPase [Actinomycetes bacterium]